METLPHPVDRRNVTINQMLAKLSTIVTADNPVEFADELVAVAEPDGDNGLRVERLELHDGRLFGAAAYYDDGSWIEDADPVDVDSLAHEEIANLLDAACRAQEGIAQPAN